MAGVGWGGGGAGEEAGATINFTDLFFNKTRCSQTG